MKKPRIIIFWQLLLWLLPFAAQAQFTFTTNNGAITITGYTGVGGHISIPSTINGYPVTSIGANAFYLKTTLTGVVMPNSITNIGSLAFGKCSGLTNVTIPNSVISIGSKAFVVCSALTTVTMGNSITSIGADAFALCSGLNSVTIPDNVTIIGDEAFAVCSSLTNLTIGKNVTIIGTNAFGNCSGLTSVTIPSSVASIGAYAFWYCTNLHQMYFQGNAPSVNGGTGSTDNTVFEGVSGTAYYVPGSTGWDATFGGWPTAGWYQPQPQILDTSYGLGGQSNKFNFTISWATNTSIIVEASTNLQSWMPVITNALVNGTNAFSDSAYTNFSKRFYRVRSQ